MKIEDGIIKQLADQGYLKLNIKISNMDLFYRANAFRQILFCFFVLFRERK